MADMLKILSVIAGWGYFVAWSASFYPQALLNYRRQYVGGLSIDSCFLSVLGHISYLVYNVALYSNKSVQHEYRLRHDGANNTVQLNDVAFSVHAALLELVGFWQICYYPRERGQRLSDFNRVVVSIYLIVLGVNAYLLSVVQTKGLYDFVVHNYRRQFVGGLSIDFCVLNLLGHMSYLIYNATLYSNESVQDEYRRRHDGVNNIVQLNDVAFSAHAVSLALVWLGQTLYYPRAPGQRTSSFNRVVVSIYLIVLSLNAYALFVPQTESLYDFVNILALFKLYVSVAKYIPQAWENYRSQSTAGWSIGSVLLDFSGGTLSFIQLFADAVRTSDWTSITGNPAKFGLSVLSVIFTSFYIVQHYVLYPDHQDEHLTKDAAHLDDASIPRDRSRSLQPSGDRAPLLGP